MATRRNEYLVSAQITCAGSAVFDILSKSSGELPIGVLGLVDQFSTAEGGPALRTGRVLAGMGIRTRLIIPIGDDLFGRSFRETVPAPNLDVAWVESEHPTSTSMVFVDKDGERTMLHNLGADASITAEAIESRMEGPILHVGGSLVLPGLDDPDGRPLAELFERARARGIFTSVDVVHDSTGQWHRTVPALAFTDLFIPSLVEMQGITGVAGCGGRGGDPAATWVCASPSSPTVPGARGSNHDDFVGHIPAFRVETIDTTGAGDAFTGGVLTGIIHGLGSRGRRSPGCRDRRAGDHHHRHLLRP